jgi:hypothetical protein
MRSVLFLGVVAVSIVNGKTNSRIDGSTLTLTGICKLELNFETGTDMSGFTGPFNDCLPVQADTGFQKTDLPDDLRKAKITGNEVKGGQAKYYEKLFQNNDDTPTGFPARPSWQCFVGGRKFATYFGPYTAWNVLRSLHRRLGREWMKSLEPNQICRLIMMMKYKPILEQLKQSQSG